MARGVGIAQSLGSFLSSVAAEGLDSALDKRGLAELVGRAPGEVLAGIADALAGNGASLSEAVVRAAEVDALGRLFDESLETYEDLREIWNSQMDERYVLLILEEFLADLVFELWSSDMADKLESGEVIPDIVAEREQSVREFIRAQVSFEVDRIDVLSVDWEGPEGRGIIQDCLHTALGLMED